MYRFYKRSVGALALNKKFDIDLAYGLAAENKLYHHIAGSKIELKTERDSWQATGNVAIEFEYRGQPSGIAVTQATFWCHELRRNNYTLLYLMFPTWKLKQICRKYYSQNGYVIGGDNKASKMILLPIKDLLGHV